MRNKKGEKLFSLWWFFILGIVGVGIVGGVLIFYSAEIDVREAESLILYDRIANCLMNSGHLIENLFDENFEIFSECGLNKEIIESGNFYFEISLFDFEGNLVKEELFFGARTFKENCRISREIVAKKFPKCTDKKENIFYFQNGVKKSGSLSILTASNQIGRKIK